VVRDEAKYIQDLIAEGEHTHLDFKFEITSARKIARTLVAFANTGGGRLLIGVKDNGNIKGVQSEEEFYMIEAASTLYCQPEVPFESFHRSVGGKTILEIVVYPSDRKPHYALDERNKWLAYIRVRDQNLLANAILIQVWKRQRSPKGTFLRYTDNETRLLRYLKEESGCTFQGLKDRMKIRSAQLKNMLVNLISLGVVSIHFEENEILYSAPDRKTDGSVDD
jgi:predicted HTH transcriptional regulator